ncbi:MAG: hypothetical protein ABI134_22045 [Byssovorax sp.]
MKQLIRLCALVPGLVFGLGCMAEEASTTATATATSALTTGDVDFAPECGGILGYANWASLSELDAYLPNTVANAIVQRRAVQPFTSIADLSSVSGIAQARLAQITSRAYTYDFIDVECAGVYEELAVSYDDRVAILAYANTASASELASVVRFEPANVVPQLIARRPFTTLQHLVDTYGVGPATFRSLRDAAIDGPFDVLAEKVNSVHREAIISRSFDWFDVVVDQPGQQKGMECFGVDAALVNSFGGVLRPNLATAGEVQAEVADTVSYADRYGEVGDATAGLADLAALTTGQIFFGCYISFQPDPWSQVNRAFFVNTQTGYRILSETSWSE